MSVLLKIIVTTGGIKVIADFLEDLCAKNGSDLHLKVGNFPYIRVNGELEIIPGSNRITMEDMKIIVDEMMTPEKKERFNKTKSLDFSYSIPGKGRFRTNMFVQRGTNALAIRRIEDNIKKMEELGLPKVLKEIANTQRGLVLITGATGNGKSTTVASIIGYINDNFVRNVITLEDPIEFLFRDNKSIISQREIPNDIDSYDQALKYVMRQDPDIIFIGELRDKETIDAAIKASETGHLVISTLHTVDASQTITRIIDFYPPEHQKQLRYQLSKNLKAVVSQRLLASKDRKSRVAAIEVMLQTPSIIEMILTPEGVKNIPEAIRNGKEIYGMQTFDQSIGELYLADKITYNTAIDAATQKKEIELLKRGISYESTNDLYKGILATEY